MLPVLVTVNVSAPLVVDVGQLPKSSGFGATLADRMTGTPLPVNVTGDPLTVTLV
jgi:hypothetical protein